MFVSNQEKNELISNLFDIPFEEKNDSSHQDMDVEPASEPADSNSSLALRYNNSNLHFDSQEAFEHACLEDQKKLFYTYFELYQNRHGEQIAFIKDSVEKLLIANLPFKDKIRELGSLLYFLQNSPTFFIPNHGFYSLVKETMQKKMMISEEHQQVLEGKTAALIQMTHIIFTPFEKINMGGVYAIRSMLQEGLFANQTELRFQCLRIISEIIHNKALVNLLETPINSDFKLSKKFILQDLQIPNTNVSSVLAKQACLLAMLYDIRQTEQNCYAVGSLIYAIYHKPYKVFQKLMEIVGFGCLIEENIQFPIFTMMEGRVTRDQNSLQIALLTALEFLEVNTPYAPINPKKEDPFPIKCDMIAFLQRKLEIALKNTNFPKDFLENFFQIMEKSLWLVDKNEKCIHLEEENSIRFYKDPTNFYFLDCTDFKDKLPQLLKLFQNCRELYFITPKYYQKIEIFSDFGKVFNQIIQMAAIETFGEEEAMEFENLTLMRRLLEISFTIIDKKKFATFLYDVNKSQFPDLHVSDYHNLNRIQFIQHGGVVDRVPYEFLDIQAKCIKVESITAEETICKIIAWIYKLPRSDKKDLIHIPLIGSSNNHTFIITSYRFNPIWYQENKTINEMFDVWILNPSNRLLKEPLSKEKIEKILIATDWKSSQIRNLVIKYSKEPAQKFRDDMLKHLFNKEAIKFKELFHKEATSLSYRQILEIDLLKKMLECTSLQLSGSVIQAIERSFLKEIDPTNACSYSAATLSFMIKKILSVFQIYELEVYHIEALIYQIAKLPCVIEIGDLNTGTTSQEHNYLIYKYDLGESDFKLFLRAKDVEKRLEDKQFYDGFKKVLIYWPKVFRSMEVLDQSNDSKND